MVSTIGLLNRKEERKIIPEINTLRFKQVLTSKRQQASGDYSNSRAVAQLELLGPSKLPRNFFISDLLLSQKFVSNIKRTNNSRRGHKR